MANLVAGNVAVDLTTWAFTPGWHSVSHSATQFVIAQDSTQEGQTPSPAPVSAAMTCMASPTTGTITAFSFDQNNVHQVSVSDISISVADERNYSTNQGHSQIPGPVAGGRRHLQQFTRRTIISSG